MTAWKLAGPRLVVREGACVEIGSDGEVRGWGSDGISPATISEGAAAYRALSSGRLVFYVARIGRVRRAHPGITSAVNAVLDVMPNADAVDRIDCVLAVDADEAITRPLVGMRIA